MLRCPTCGRDLLGVRADHPALCKIQHLATVARALPNVALAGAQDPPLRHLATAASNDHRPARRTDDPLDKRDAAE